MVLMLVDYKESVASTQSTIRYTTILKGGGGGGGNPLF